MKQKKIFYTEAAYGLGLFCIVFGASLMERANFGMSMIVAPVYVVYRKLAAVLPFFTFGMAEYVMQAILLIAMCLVLRRFRLSDIFSFVTAVIYGLMLDGCMLLTAPLLDSVLAVRLLLCAVGMLLGAAGVSLVFHTYIAPEVYELFTKEVARHFGIELHRFKTGYDCVSCAAAILLSFLFFGFGVFVGVRVGTVVCAIVNGSVIGFCTKFLEARFDFADALPFRPFFTGEPSVRRNETE